MARVPTTPETKRGKAKDNTQLSLLQKHILLWLLEQEERIQKRGSRLEKKELYTKGIKWGKQFFKHERNSQFFTGSPSDSSKLSTSLSKLARRKLVKPFDITYGQGKKPRTTHVQLMDKGSKAANDYRDDPRRWQEKRLEESLKRKQAAKDYHEYRKGY